MSLSQSPSGSIVHKKTIFQKLFGKVKGAVMALGILSTPVIAQSDKKPELPPIEERLALSQKMNLEGIKSFQELENTIEFIWSQLKDTPKAPKEIRDQYGHITTEGLTWLKSYLPKEHLTLLIKNNDTQKKVEGMNKKDPKWGVWEYSLICLGGLLIGLVGYQLGKVSKKEIERLKKEYEEVLDIAAGNATQNTLLSVSNEALKKKIEEMKKAQGKPWGDAKVVDAETVDPEKTPEDPAEEISRQEIPEWAKNTFLTEEAHKNISRQLFADLSSDAPSQEAKNLQESITNLSNTTGTHHEKAGRLNVMSEKFITYATSKGLPGNVIHTLLRSLVRSFEGQEFHFGSCPVIGQQFDNTQMLQVGTARSAVLKVSKVLSLPVFGPNRHPEAVTKNVIYSRGKVNC